jgi:hypothetical protein
LYACPVEHYMHTLTAHPIEPPSPQRGCVESAQKLRLARDHLGDGLQAGGIGAEGKASIQGFSKLELVVNNVPFCNGEAVTDQSQTGMSR